MLVDSHAHLNFPELMTDIDGVLTRAREAGVKKIINIGTSLGDSRAAIELAQKYNNLYATVGIHPNDDTPTTVENIDWGKFQSLAKTLKVVAIGETGLDFSRSQDKERQIKLFRKQIEIGLKLNLPLSIHIRDAYEDVMKIDLTGLRGVFHCFSGNKEYLDWILRLLPGFYISFAGNVTFKNAKELQELAKLVPLDRLLVETDCPFLAPEPHRGMRNEPVNVKITAARLAELRETTLENIAEVTTRNAKILLRI